LFLPDETLALEAGMNIAVHPTAANDSVWASVCDNYIIGENGVGACLHSTPQEVIVI